MNVFCTEYYGLWGRRTTPHSATPLHAFRIHQCSTHDTHHANKMCAWVSTNFHSRLSRVATFIWNCSHSTLYYYFPRQYFRYTHIFVVEPPRLVRRSFVICVLPFCHRTITGNQMFQWILSSVLLRLFHQMHPYCVHIGLVCALPQIKLRNYRIFTCRM